MHHIQPTYMGNKCFFREWHKKFLPLLSTTLESHYITTKYSPNLTHRSHTYSHTTDGLSAPTSCRFFTTQHILYTCLSFFIHSTLLKNFTLCHLGCSHIFLMLGLFLNFTHAYHKQGFLDPSYKKKDTKIFKTYEFFTEKLYVNQSHYCVHFGSTYRVKIYQLINKTIPKKFEIVYLLPSLPKVVTLNSLSVAIT